ncbi:AAA family ATPase [Gilvirhabdus luticola]|uniref:hypothetical protein n=1 Tax=Gilvirhabdus luticola TaxID=3079858 RepID=UPI00391B9CFD
MKKGIDYEYASKIIGNHFPEVNDKLLNLLQLNKDRNQSELLIASIEQKSLQLKPIPFRLAIDFKNSLKYLKYTTIPIIILLVSFVLVDKNWFSDSYKRVVHYQTAYEPPAPFQFYVLNENLTTNENVNFKLVVKTLGDIVPEAPQIVFNGESYYLQQNSTNEFEYLFSQPKENVSFKLFANNVTSKEYELEVNSVPALLNFEMNLDYPLHTHKKDEIIKNTGRAIIPEGTKVSWQLRTKAASKVNLYCEDTLQFQFDAANAFSASKSLYRNFSYSINLSNDKLKDYESLAFNIDVIKDEYPELKLKSEIDSLDHQTLYFYGQVSDDYGLRKLNLVYYPIEDEAQKQIEEIPLNGSNLDDFISVFPDNHNLVEGISYNLYFQLFDNDVINNFKSVKSKIFTFRKLTKEEETQNKLQEQSQTINELSKSLKKIDEQDKRLEDFSKTQKEKQELNFNDKKRLEDFIKRQKQQDEMMKNFNKRLKDNLEDFQKENEEEDTFKEDLKNRLNENEEQLKQDEQLLKELKELQEKINKEQLTEKLEQLAKQNKNKKRSLEQLLELTKRYYIGKKLEKLQEELESQAKEQEKLSNEREEDNTKDKQDELNRKFEDFQQEMEELKKENQELKKPLDINESERDEKQVEEMQQNASEELQKKEESSDSDEKQKTQNKAKQNQKRASEKMKQMAQKMAQAMQAASGEQLNEDTEMLRQILDNLVLFSFEQETLMNRFKTIEINHSKYPSYLRKQSNLREHFEHIDDSLFALSLRQPKLSETVNKEIIEAFYNIDKSLEELAENRLYSGVASQQYTITAANNLADFLSNVLDNLQQQLNPAPGQGGDGDMQLPDIIMSQEQLNKKMEEGIKDGEDNPKKDGDTNEGEEGKEKKEGDREGNKLGEGQNNSEQLNGQLYEIYQSQQKIRQELEERIAKDGLKGQAGNLLKKMEDIELELLNKGFTNQTLERMIKLHHQLLKLDKATFQQGQDNKRESQTNKNIFNENPNSKIPTAKEYFNTTEILNRYALPLQPNYKEKVKEYFNKENDSI